VFYHKEKQLGYYLKDIGAKSANPLTIKLQRCGSASGRVVDEDGQPVARVELHVTGDTFGGLGEPSGGAHQILTDKDGRFHVAGLVGGQAYAVSEWSQPSFPRIYAHVTVEAGQHKDIGDIKVKERDQ